MSNCGLLKKTLEKPHKSRATRKPRNQKVRPRRHAHGTRH